MQVSTTSGIYSEVFGAPKASAPLAKLLDAVAQSYGVAGAAPVATKSATAQFLDLSTVDSSGLSNFDVLSAYYGAKYTSL